MPQDLDFLDHLDELFGVLLDYGNSTTDAIIGSASKTTNKGPSRRNVSAHCYLDIDPVNGYPQME